MYCIMGSDILDKNPEVLFSYRPMRGILQHVLSTLKCMHGDEIFVIL